MNRLEMLNRNQIQVGVGSRQYSPENLLATMITYLRAGTNLVDTCALIRGWKSPNLTVDMYTISSLISHCVSGKAHELTRLKAQLSAVCLLSYNAGCSAVKCLEILLEDVKRTRDLEDKRKDATSIAVLTVRVLLGLPILTTVLSELTGVHAIAFLFTTPVGFVCLLISSALYGVGLMWAERLIGSFHKEVHMNQLGGV